MASVTEELKELFALFEKGALTREQFESMRDQLMAASQEVSLRSSDGGGTRRSVGAYRITGHVGDGGMGSVFRGEHRSRGAIGER